MTTQQVPKSFPFPKPPSIYHPSPEYAELQREQPVTKVDLPDGGSAWLVTRYADVRQVLTDPRFSRALAAQSDRPKRGLELLAADSILGMDPPEHTRLRKLVASAFTARRVSELRPSVVRIVDELLDGLVDQPRPADLVHHFSLALPVRVICTLLGVPAEDLDKFHGWSDSVMADWDQDPDAIIGGFQAIGGYIAGLIEIKREEPADDLMTALIAARDEQDRLSEEELVRLGLTLLVAGHETTANQINMSLLTLLKYPDELAKLRDDPGLIPGAVEELMRFVQLGGGAGGPVERIATEDMELGGVLIPAGDAVLPIFNAANRDPLAYDDPDRLDVTRQIASHLAFGAGVHHCLGAQLARMELQEAFAGLVRRLPGLRLAVPVEELRFKSGMIVYSLHELPVTWDTP